MNNEELKQAIAVVNSTRRRTGDPTLVHYVVCDRCGNGFAKLPQDYKLAEKNGHPHRCRICKN